MSSKINSQFRFLKQFSPCFPVSGDNIKVLDTPAEFYDTLLQGIKSAKKRIVLSALYLGTGSHEKQLLDCLNSTMQERETEKISMDIDILFDYLRGSRGNVNTKTMLLPLVQKYCDSEQNSKQNITVSLYHTPFLRGTVKKAFPARFNEIVGLNHLKIFVFDDSFLISGANLSTDYFERRQDRYILFENCKNLSDYFHSIVKAIGKFSFQLRPDGDVALPDVCPCDPVTGSRQEFENFVVESLNDVLKLRASQSETFASENAFYLSSFYETVKNVIVSPIRNLSSLFENDSSAACESDAANDATKNFDTFVFPSVQFGFVGIRQDEAVTSKLLESFPVGSYLCFTSGYFNITKAYSDKILNSFADFDIVTASPDANGFLNASGAAGKIPAVYSLLTKNFYDEVLQRDKGGNIRIWEYIRPTWTYHAKGMWFYPKDSFLPSMTVIGSSNFGLRSVHRDLEAQVTILTKNENLRKQLHREKCNIMKYSSQMSSETFAEARYHVPRWVSFVTTFIKRYF